ncbi:uncharacterized protein LOC122527757 [Frieseomelitta varia]|uniref:uncharacterized protein LOC122527757 n=1 Tax=Frieseomelitta varia TaxID=561572 RepID=UPI001CB68027|nr:uncharacterized protein LOC122527757 [Frieseomelitta varia]
MLKQVTPEKAINIIWLSVALTFCWPLSANSNKTEILGYKIMQICAIISVCLLLLPSIYLIYLCSDDMEVISKSVSQLICEVQCIIQTVICFCKHDTLQRLVEELWTCIKQAQPHERKIFCTYLVRYSTLYGGYLAIAYVMAFLFTIGPLIFPFAVLIQVEYPFDVNRTLVIAVIRAHQIVVCYQCCAHMCLCVFGALLIWFTAARFECLIVEVQRSTDIRMLVLCIEKQLRLERYAKEVVNCFRFMVLFVIAACTFVMTLSAIVMVMNTPLMVKIMYTTMTSYFVMYIYMYAWPANHMKDMSLTVSRSVYDLKWYECTAKLQKYLLNMLMYRKPVILSISCLVPELSLRYYCSYLSNALSFCTALRAILEGNKT